MTSVEGEKYISDEKFVASLNFLTNVICRHIKEPSRESALATIGNINWSTELAHRNCEEPTYLTPEDLYETAYDEWESWKEDGKHQKLEYFYREVADSIYNHFTPHK